MLSTLLPREDVSGTRSRASRFLGVTFVTAALGQILILTFFSGFGWPALVANGVAVIIVAICGFFLSVRFVWTHADESARGLQITAFFVTGAIGLLISSGTVHLVTQRVDHWLAANIGSFLGYGLAWLLRFVVLDRHVFADGS